MPCPSTSSLLNQGAASRIVAAIDAYPLGYDEVLEDVHVRLMAAGHATKLDLAALIAWKHVRNAPWMRSMLTLPAGTIEKKTEDAFASSVSDDERLVALRGIPGFGSGGAFTSVLLTAWDPARFGVFDDQASNRGWPEAVNSACSCERWSLPVYFDHLRQLAKELSELTENQWTPRDVDKALLNLDSSKTGLAGSSGTG